MGSTIWEVFQLLDSSDAIRQSAEMPKQSKNENIESYEKAFSKWIFTVTTQHQFAMEQSRAPAPLDEWYFTKTRFGLFIFDLVISMRNARLDTKVFQSSAKFWND